MSTTWWLVIAGVVLLGISRLGIRLLRLALIVVVGVAIAIAAGVPLGPMDALLG